MPERVTAEDRLSRILYLIPAARGEGARIADLAAALGVSEREVVRDLEELTDRTYYHHAGTGDDIQIELVPDHVRIWTKHDFDRPVRLSPREALALGLGLRALAAEAAPARRAELLALAARLEMALAVPDVQGPRGPDVQESRGPRYLQREPLADVEYPREPAAPYPGERLPSDADRFATILARDEEDILSMVIDAARERQCCRIRYLKAGAPAPEDREIHPYHLVHAEGRWYVLAHAVDRAAIRAFRIDRILEAEARAETFGRPADFDPAHYIAGDGRLFFADDDVEVAVRYSRRIARWVAERAACEADRDGAVVVRHRVADPRWVVRHVLQYGADAEVIEPVEVRAMVGAAAMRVCG